MIVNADSATIVLASLTCPAHEAHIDRGADLPVGPTSEDTSRSTDFRAVREDSACCRIEEFRISVSAGVP